MYLFLHKRRITAEPLTLSISFAQEALQVRIIKMDVGNQFF
jgi:hypothetical protein